MAPFPSRMFRWGSNKKHVELDLLGLDNEEAYRQGWVNTSTSGAWNRPYAGTQEPNLKAYQNPQASTNAPVSFHQHSVAPRSWIPFQHPFARNPAQTAHNTARFPAYDGVQRSWPSATAPFHSHLQGRMNLADPWIDKRNCGTEFHQIMNHGLMLVPSRGVHSRTRRRSSRGGGRGPLRDQHQARGPPSWNWPSEIRWQGDYADYPLGQSGRGRTYESDPRRRRVTFRREDSIIPSSSSSTLVGPMI